MNDQFPPPLDPPKKSNAKWWVMGCSGCFLIVAVIAGFLMYGAYKGAKALGGDLKSGFEMLATIGQAMQSPEVTEALGTDVKIEGVPTSQETETTRTYSAGLSGAKGKGQAVVEMEKQPDGSWKIIQIKFTPDGGAEMELKTEGFQLP